MDVDLCSSVCACVSLWRFMCAHLCCVSLYVLLWCCALSVFFLAHRATLAFVRNTRGTLVCNILWLWCFPMSSQCAPSVAPQCSNLDVATWGPSWRFGSGVRISRKIHPWARVHASWTPALDNPSAGLELVSTQSTQARMASCKLIQQVISATLKTSSLLEVPRMSEETAAELSQKIVKSLPVVCWQSVAKAIGTATASAG